MRNKDEQTERGGHDRRLANKLGDLLATARDLHRRGHLNQAATLYRTILSVDAGNADALNLLGVLTHGSGNPASACELIGRAVAARPDVAQYHFNLGVSLQALLHHVQAAAAYRDAIALQPGYREAFENLGVALQDLGDRDAAADAYRRALALDPDSAIANQNLGTLLGNLGETNLARDHFAKVLARHPAYGDAHMKTAWVMLLEGELDAGWREYGWRVHSDSFTADNPLRVVPFPRWDGSSLRGKTILINPEQGIGDEIMFASCYRDVIAQAKHVVIECDPRLVDLFARSFPTTTVLAANRPSHFEWFRELPAIDYRIAAGCLPRFFRPTLESFAPGSAYLSPNSELRSKWRTNVAALGGALSIGISWRGGRDPRSAAARSIALADWLPILRFPDATFVNLQYGDHSAEIAAVEREHGVRVHSLDGIDPLDNVDEFVALLSALDLVISIDNSTVFMAGAVATPVWVLLPSSGEWRWLKNRATSPWYASAALWRQREAGLPAWRELLSAVARSLEAGVERRDSPEADLPCTPRSGTVLRRSPAREPTVVFVNDSSHWYHYGCSCTSLAIHTALRNRAESVLSVPIHLLTRLKHLPTDIAGFDDEAVFTTFAKEYAGIFATLARADRVYVNGEGALHGIASQALGLLYLIYLTSTRLGKPVHLINHSCYPDDSATPSEGPALALYQKVYQRLAFVAVRELISARLVERMGIRATESFDCLPLFVDRYFRPGNERRAKRILIAGSVSWGGADAVPALAEYIERMAAAGFEIAVLIGANAYLAADDFVFVDALRAACRGRFLLLNATSELEWLATIAESALLVSGRFHHTIAAACVDTPCIVMESNTPKIAALLEMLGLRTFVSVREPALADVLYERSLQYVAHHGDVLVKPATKARILELGRKNFEAAAALRGT